MSSGESQATVHENKCRRGEPGLMLSSLEAFVLLRNRIKGGGPVSRRRHHSHRGKKHHGEQDSFLKMSPNSQTHYGSLWQTVLREGEIEPIDRMMVAGQIGTETGGKGDGDIIVPFTTTPNKLTKLSLILLMLCFLTVCLLGPLTYMSRGLSLYWYVFLKFFSTFFFVTASH